MLKTGFRGERKRNPHPVHILSYSETSPKERGCSDEERMTNDGGNRGECGGKSKETSPFTHTQLLLATSKGGM